ncbi:MAG TPA: hypothetical protein VKC56_04350 [Gallionellaceae bacterium]|nr:hypothetical protein [Gallionellaceae bacterium]
MDNPEKPATLERPDTPETASRPETQATPEAEQKAGLYDRFVELSRDIFAAGQDKGREAMEKAMERAREQMTAAGEFTSDQGETFKRYMRRDLEQTREEMRQFGESAKETLHPARLGAGALSSLSKIMKAAGHALAELSSKAESALEYESGEVTMAGTLTCLACGEKVQLRHTAVVPECPKCGGTRFRKSY